MHIHLIDVKTKNFFFTNVSTPEFAKTAHYVDIYLFFCYIFFVLDCCCSSSSSLLIYLTNMAHAVAVMGDY